MAVKKTVEIDVDAKDAIKNVDGFTKSVNDADDAVKDLNKDLKDTGDEAKDLGKKTSSGGKAAGGGIGFMSKAFKGLGVSIKAAGIALVISLFGALFNALKENQVVMDAVNKVFTTISIVMSSVVNALINAYESAKNATGGFDALGKVIHGILTLTITPLKLAFFGLKLGIQELQLAWEKWVGDADPKRIQEIEGSIQETKQAIQDTADAAVEAGSDIYNNFSEAVGEVTTLATESVRQVSQVSIESARQQADALVELRKQAELAEVRNQGLIEQYDRQAEQLRQIRDEERNSLSERIEANERLAQVLDEQERVMLENANIQVRLAQAELRRNNNTENQRALIEAQNELLAIQAQVEGFRSEQKANELALDKERLELERTITDAQLEADAILREANQSLSDDKLEQLRMERQVIEENYNAEAELIANRLAQLEEAGQMETQMYADLQAEKIVLDADYRASAIENENEIAKEKIELAKKEREAKIALAGDVLSAVAAFTAEGSALGKGVAIAQATIDTYKGATNALANTPLPAPFPQIAAAAVIASGIAQVRKIAATKIPTAAGVSSPSVGAGGGVAATGITAPQLSIGDVNPQLNQIQQSIDNQNQRPVRAQVVSEEVSSGQALDRRTLQTATFGGG